MTWQPRDQRDGAEADRRARQQDRPPRCYLSGLLKERCECFRCQPEQFVRKTAEMKAENDRLGRPSPPLGRHVRKL